MGELFLLIYKNFLFLSPPFLLPFPPSLSLFSFSFFPFSLGSPGPAICRIADEKRPDFIIMGRRGLGALTEFVSFIFWDYCFEYYYYSLYIIVGDKQKTYLLFLFSFSFPFLFP